MPSNDLNWAKIKKLPQYTADKSFNLHGISAPKTPIGERNERILRWLKLGQPANVIAFLEQLQVRTINQIKSFDPILTESENQQTVLRAAVQDFCDMTHSFYFTEIKNHLEEMDLKISDGHLCRLIQSEGETLYVPATSWLADNPKFNPGRQEGAQDLLDKLEDYYDEIFFVRWNTGGSSRCHDLLEEVL